MSSAFKHYDRTAIEFLVELTSNNEREWFKKNQARYEALVREPTLAFIRAIAPRVAKISSHLVASDSKVGGSMMRPQRDIRFARDKTPYKTHVGVQFRHELGKDVHAPGLYVHFDPAEVFVGIGMWHPDPESLQAIRSRIEADPAAWKRIRNAGAFGKLFELSVLNSGVYKPSNSSSSTHVGIENTKKRLQLLYGNLSKFTIENIEIDNKPFVLTKLVLPLNNKSYKVPNYESISN